MSRPLRIEYEGAWYHVMNRGTDRKVIFTKDEHRLLFLELLQECVSLYQIEVHAYCLMDNHYHLLIRTPHANLGRAMRHLNGVYTQRFNRFENRDGPLYKGRYKAKLIEENNYLLQVNRYIHLNPVEACVCNQPEHYRWSSYLCYLNKNNQQTWITTSTIISEFNSLQEYVEYIANGIDDVVKKVLTTENSPVILATNNFINEKINALTAEKIDETFPDVKRTKPRPSIEIIIEEVSIFFNLNKFSIKKPLRGEKNIPRLLSMYLSRKMGFFTYGEIGNVFNRTMYAVSAALKRFEDRLKYDSQLYIQLTTIEKKVNDKL